MDKDSFLQACVELVLNAEDELDEEDDEYEGGDAEPDPVALRQLLEGYGGRASMLALMEALLSKHAASGVECPECFHDLPDHDIGYVMMRLANAGVGGFGEIVCELLERCSGLQGEEREVRGVPFTFEGGATRAEIEVVWDTFRMVFREGNMRDSYSVMLSKPLQEHMIATLQVTSHPTVAASVWSTLCGLQCRFDQFWESNRAKQLLAHCIGHVDSTVSSTAIGAFADLVSPDADHAELVRFGNEVGYTLFDAFRREAQQACRTLETKRLTELCVGLLPGLGRMIASTTDVIATEMLQVLEGIVAMAEGSGGDSTAGTVCGMVVAAGAVFFADGMEMREESNAELKVALLRLLVRYLQLPANDGLEHLEVMPSFISSLSREFDMSAIAPAALDFAERFIAVAQRDHFDEQLFFLTLEDFVSLNLETASAADRQRRATMIVGVIDRYVETAHRSLDEVTRAMEAFFTLCGTLVHAHPNAIYAGPVQQTMMRLAGELNTEMSVTYFETFSLMLLGSDKSWVSGTSANEKEVRRLFVLLAEGVYNWWSREWADLPLEEIGIGLAGFLFDMCMHEVRPVFQPLLASATTERMLVYLNNCELDDRTSHLVESLFKLLHDYWSVETHSRTSDSFKQAVHTLFMTWNAPESSLHALPIELMVHLAGSLFYVSEPRTRMKSVGPWSGEGWRI